MSSSSKRNPTAGSSDGRSRLALTEGRWAGLPSSLLSGAGKPFSEQMFVKVVAGGGTHLFISIYDSRR
jgi:hypothetical protein